MNENEMVKARWSHLRAAYKADLPALTVARARRIPSRVSRLRAGLEDSGGGIGRSGPPPRGGTCPRAGDREVPSRQALDSPCRDGPSAQGQGRVQGCGRLVSASDRQDARRSQRTYLHRRCPGQVWPTERGRDGPSGGHPLHSGLPGRGLPQPWPGPPRRGAL